MRFSVAVDTYIDDMKGQGRLNSPRSEATYRSCLSRFAEEVGNRDPRAVGRDDVKRYLRRFPHPNTQRRQRSMLSSFFKWTMWEGLRKDNPAEQTRPPRARAPQVYRLTLEETRRFLAAARGQRERRIAFLGVCAGLRRDEIRLLQGRHFAREGWVWVSADIAKGGRERWVPVLADLDELVLQIRRTVEPGHYVIPAQQFADPPRNRRVRDYPERPADGKTIWRTTRRIGRRAGIAAAVNPHMLRHAFADHIARLAGVRQAQMLLGHASIATTEGYLGAPTLDELAAAVGHVEFGVVATPSKEGPRGQEWRRWESNPRPRARARQLLRA